MKKPTRLEQLANQISILEGYPKKGTLAQRQNNPGNLRYVGQLGAVRGDKGFARFKTPQEGFQALHRQILLDASRKLTLKQFVYKYAPPNQNNSVAYLNHVSRSLNIHPLEPLSNIVK